MGLFDKVVGREPEKMGPADGFAGVVLCAVAADGVVTNEELQGLGTSLSRMRLFRDLTPRQANAAFERALRLLKDQGADGLLKISADAIPTDLRPTAFAIAADLLFADQDVTASERKFLEQVQRALQVEDDLALRIVEVVSIKNKG